MLSRRIVPIDTDGSPSCPPNAIDRCETGSGATLLPRRRRCQSGATAPTVVENSSVEACPAIDTGGPADNPLGFESASTLERALAPEREPAEIIELRWSDLVRSDERVQGRERLVIPGKPLTRDGLSPSSTHRRPDDRQPTHIARLIMMKTTTVIPATVKNPRGFTASNVTSTRATRA
jgi:hypothetical protein